MKHKAKIIFETRELANIKLLENLAVALPCGYCQRNRRTVWLALNKDGVCSPGSAKRPGKHPSHGQVTSLDIERSDGLLKATYHIEYEAPIFEDTKYGGFNPKPSWGRIYFELTCNGCGKTQKSTTQSNLVRPHSRGCECGSKLYEEFREMPLMYYFNSETKEWEQIPPRWDAE